MPSCWTLFRCFRPIERSLRRTLYILSLQNESFNSLKLIQSLAIVFVSPVLPFISHLQSITLSFTTHFFDSLLNYQSFIEGVQTQIKRSQSNLKIIRFQNFLQTTLKQDDLMSSYISLSHHTSSEKP